MILIDLKLTLFIVLLLAAGCVGAIWLIARQGLRPRRSPNMALAHIRGELPIGLAVLHADGTIVQANAEARHVLADSDSSALLLSEIAHDHTPESLTSRVSSSGFSTHPVAIRWWRYPLDDHTSLLMILDRNEYQRLVSRQQRFIGQLAHELRTPLTAMIAHLEVVRSAATSDVLRARSLDTFQHETNRLARLVHDLLELHRLETANDLALSPTNLLLVAEDAMAHVFPHSEQRGVTLTLDADTSIPLVLAQADRLKQVFLNVLDNAIKYSRPNDRITVRLRSTPAGVQCIVADSGPGIDGAELPHVRTPLYRGQTNIEGNGIGLALVDEILQRHHATLVIESNTDPAQSGTSCSWYLRVAGETR